MQIGTQYTERRNSKDLLCGTGNYTQPPVINHNGKEHEKGFYIFMCIYNSVTLLYSKD